MNIVCSTTCAQYPVDCKFSRFVRLLLDFVYVGDDILDRGRAPRRLLRQQPPGTVRRHGRIPGLAASPSAKPLEAPRQAADRIQGLW